MNPVVANIVVQTFATGGWVMWPIAGTFFIALCVVLDRAAWWLRHRETLRPADRAHALDALHEGDFPAAWSLTRRTPDPFLAILRDGLAHAHTSMPVAMQLRATLLLGHSQARMWVLSTLITLAPLLGLFGTVVGLMESFAAIGTDQLAVTKVTGGIGEALIATACGIAIAVLCLLPYNFFRKRVALLRSTSDRWIHHTALLVKTAGEHGHDIRAFAAGRSKPRPVPRPH